MTGLTRAHHLINALTRITQPIVVSKSVPYEYDAYARNVRHDDGIWIVGGDARRAY